jgi:predicted secreted protein
MAFRHGKSTRVLIGSSDLSTYFNDTSVSTSVETAETTTYGVAGDSKTYVTGLNDSTISISGLFADEAGEADEVITAAIGSDTDVVFTIAQDGGLIVGRRCLLGQSIETKYDLSSPVADVVSTSLDLQSDGESVHGFVLAASESISSTSTGTSVDGIASSSNGGIATLHVTANTRDGSITVKVQHSADNVTFADLATFSVVPSTTITSERLSVASGTTVNRYLRVSYTVAGSTGSATIAAAFGRR